MKKISTLLLAFLVAIMLSGCNIADEAGQPDSALGKETTSTEGAAASLSGPDTTVGSPAESEEQQALPSEKESIYPMEITDFRGNVTTITSEPLRVISLSPNITEIIYALGKGETLVGRTAFCDYPEEVLNVDIVGDFYEWNLETIVSLEPDVVFASALNTEENEKKLKDLGLNVVFLTDIQSFESTYDTISMIGKVLNAHKNAADIIESMKQTVAEVEDAVKGLENPSVYYIAGYGEYGDYTATGDTFIGAMLEMAGGKNIAANDTGWIYSLEKIVENDPYIIIGSEDAQKAFQEMEGYKELTAVKEGRIYSIDVDLLEIQGPRLAQGLYTLAKVFHPESFK
jgi:iron complex transport system substrate-binding protein